MASFIPWNINAQHGCIMIVGEKPGRQLKGKKMMICWQGSRSSALVEDAVKGMENLYLTNVVLQQKLTKDAVMSGTRKLARDIARLEPRRIIFLGLFSLKHGRRAMEKAQHECRIAYLQHPSYVLRWGKNGGRQAAEWVEDLKRLLR